MTTLRDALEDGYDLALALKTELLEERVPVPDAATMIHACCWLLADLITQAAAQHAAPVERSIALVVMQLTDAVGRLTLANTEAAAVDGLTQH